MAVPRAFTPAIPSFLAAFTGTLIFKIALFRYSTSGAEGISSALATWPRIVLCLGWDIVSALIVAGVAAMLWWPAVVEAVYGVFLVISYHIATIVGSLGIASLTANDAQAVTSCVTTSFKTQLAKDACTKGGQPAAKDAMKCRGSNTI